MRTIRIGLLLASCAGPVAAQVYTPPDPNSNPGTPTDTATAVERQSPAPKSPFGEEIPFLNPGEETITVGGVTIPLGDNRVLRARFEKYLSQPEENSEAAAEYRRNIDAILTELSPYREGGPDIKAAFQKLPAASTFPGDARLCMTLAEAVYVAMLSRQDNRNLHKLNAALEDEKLAVIRKGDYRARHDRAELRKKTTKTADDTETTEEVLPTGYGEKSLEYAEHLRRIAEIEVLKKKNIAQSEVQVLNSKIQYQANMALWTMQRRYQHVLMASRFYNQIWKDGDNSLKIDENSDVSKMFTESLGVNPTVSTLDSIANEAIQEVNKAIEAVDFLLERNELHAAQARLLEAFLIGEYLGPVATFPREQKRRIQLYVRDLFDLYAAMGARDYVKAQELVSKLRGMTNDFPSAKAESAIAAYTLASDLAFEEAKAHLLEGEKERASQEVATAIEIWPTNPKRDEFRHLIESSGAVVTTRNDFDRLLSEKNYREIFKRQYEFAPAVAGNPEKADAFRQIVTNITTIETAIQLARQADGRGNSYAAWEALAKLREQKEFSQDPDLGREIENLTPKVSPFVNALQKAREFEGRRPQQTGSAISWYLKAKRMYPDSELAEEGFQRLLDQVLPDNDTLPPAASTVN